MRGVTDYIKEHEERLATGKVTREFLSQHLIRIGFLQHERLVHLLVMLFTFLCLIVFFLVFLFFQQMVFFGLFFLCLVMSIFYTFHYFKLENTVIKWYFYYNRHAPDSGDGNKEE